MIKNYTDKIKLVVKIFFHRLSILFGPNHLETFTYYIPAPPPRKTGYREKEFDKLFNAYINSKKGYQILSVNTQAHSGPQGAGLWVLITIKVPQEKADALNSELTSFLSQHDINLKATAQDADVEGIYYIENDKDLFSNDSAANKNSGPRSNN